MPRFRFLYDPLRLKVRLGFSFLRRLSDSSEMQILNVAEKNDAARHIAAYLSDGTSNQRDGLCKYCKIYEFNAEVFGRNNRMIMTSVMGHLLELELPKEYSNWNSNPAKLFDAPLTLVCKEKSLKKSLEKEVRNCSKLIIWTDCDREGENIGFQIIDICKAVKPNIEVYRAMFSEITKDSVKAALRNLGKPNIHISNAVSVRRELDLRIGFAFTRLQTLHLRKAFPGTFDMKDVISYGSCQFPTLGFVIDRFKAICDFVPEKFWYVNVAHTKDNLTVNFNWKRNRLFEKLACEVIYDKCKEIGTAKVIKVESKPRTKKRPKPLDTVELQKLASTKLRITSKETMTVAESLYNKGFISYPRTETNIFPPDLNLVPLVSNQTESIYWGEFAQRVLLSGPKPNNGTKTDQAHPPIYPLKFTNALTGNANKIYELIVRHFLACVSKDAVGLGTTVDVMIGDEMFKAQGLMITERNYLEVYPYDKWSDKEIHIYREGDTFEPDISMAEGETTPPSLLTEADLISLMVKHGIGTDATYADHIETVKTRLYVGLQENKYFVPRTLGMGLVEGYNTLGYKMAKPELRAELEADLQRICDQELTPETVLQKYIKKYKSIFEEVQKQVQTLSEALQMYIQVQATPVEDQAEPIRNEPVVAQCSSCKSPMVLKRSQKSSFYVSCVNYPTCRGGCFFISEVLNVTPTEEKCPKCGPQFALLRFKFKEGYFVSTLVGCLGCDSQVLSVVKEWIGPPNVSSQNVASFVLEDQNDSGIGSLNGSPGCFPTFYKDASTKLCHCKVPAVRFTVKKKGLNFGRAFFSCAGSDQDKCSYFEWESKNNEKQSAYCFCGLPCRKNTAKKGANSGKEFYSCSKSLSDQSRCKFFEWVSDEGTQRAKNNCASNRRRDLQGNKERANVKSTVPRRCGNCGKFGHNRRNCPEI